MLKRYRRRNARELFSSLGSGPTAGTSIRKSHDSRRRSMRLSSADNSPQGVDAMSYYIARTCSRPFDSVLADVIERLNGMGFCVLADIDVQATLKKQIGSEIPQYRVLVTCNPRLANEGLQLENKLD